MIKKIYNLLKVLLKLIELINIIYLTFDIFDIRLFVHINKEEVSLRNNEMRRN